MSAIMRIFPTALVSPLLIVGSLIATRPAAAQSFDAVGTRAQGMAGAFVAVADDASATWWNPAGLASGPYLNAIIERGHSQEPADPAAPFGPAVRTGTSSFALAYPALGLSHYRVRVSQIARDVSGESIGAPQPDRQDPGVPATVRRSATVHTYGMTVGQSVGSHLVLASTVKLVRAGAVVSSETAQGGALDRADDLDVDRDTGFDLDLGAMVRFGWLRIGAAVQHVREPDFGEGLNRIVLDRQARVGVAMMKGKTGVFDAVTLAVDTDLTTSSTVLGDTRQVAGGGEISMFKRRLALRGGLSADSLGERRLARSTGASVALRSGIYVDGAWTIGADEQRTGWSISLRSSF
jgi:hypothetical protein